MTTGRYSLSSYHPSAISSDKNNLTCLHLWWLRCSDEMSKIKWGFPDSVPSVSNEADDVNEQYSWDSLLGNESKWQWGWVVTLPCHQSNRTSSRPSRHGFMTQPSHLIWGCCYTGCKGQAELDLLYLNKPSTGRDYDCIMVIIMMMGVDFTVESENNYGVWLCLF